MGRFFCLSPEPRTLNPEPCVVLDARRLARATKREANARAAAGAVLGDDRSIMGAGDRFAYRQAEARAAAIGFGVGAAVEHFEHLRFVAGQEAAAAVVHFDRHAA